MKALNNHVLVDVVDVSKGTKKVNVNKDSILLNYPCSSTYYCTPYLLTLSPGRYQFECWGAKGIGNGSPGLGAYTSGVIKLNDISTFFVYIGATGTFNSVPNGIKADCIGGGATDVRLSYAESWHDTKSLISRIMVAAGGAGAEWVMTKGGNGGAPDGTEGYSIASQELMATISPPTLGATNTRGGYCTTNYTIHSNQRSIFEGSFGVAGYSLSSNDLGGTGGGGYYGGATIDYSGGGSGGSSFISGHPSCNSVKNSTTITASGSSVHFSGMKFSDTKMFQGNSSMPLPSSENGIWKESNGRFKLTILRIKVCSISLKRKMKLSLLLYTCILLK